MCRQDIINYEMGQRQIQYGSYFYFTSRFISTDSLSRNTHINYILGSIPNKEDTFRWEKSCTVCLGHSRTREVSLGVITDVDKSNKPFRFHALGPIYYRAANGALLVYDITDQHSFKRVQHWVTELKKMLPVEFIMVIVGNKKDLEKQRTVSYDEAVEYARSEGAKYFETSAKLNDNVEDVFLDLCTDVSCFCLLSYLYI